MWLLAITLSATVHARTSRPEFIRSPEEAFIQNRQKPARLECAGVNTDSIQWKCNGKAISGTSQSELSVFTDEQGQEITKSVLTIEKKQVEQYFGQEDYWCTCVLRNSDNASEKSKRAYIRIAYLDSKFQRPLPESGGVKLGEEFMLDCNPPFGVPKPSVTWFKDGAPIYIDFKKYQMTESGDLIVLDVDRQAAGNYTCQAANMAGFRQTPTANVWVYAHGAWSAWSNWSSCRLPADQTCGIGVREKHRSCSNPEPIKGKPCRGQGTFKEECVRACHKTQWSPVYELGNEGQLKEQKNEQKNEHDANLIMIACLAGAAGIALIIFTVVFVYWRSRNNFNYLKKSDSGLKKSQFNANHDFDLIRTQSQVTDARTNRKDDALERLLYRHHPDHQLHGGANLSYNPMKDEYFKDDFGTRSSSGVSTEHSEKMNNKQQQQQCQAQMGVDNQPIYHSIVPPPAPQAPPPPPPPKPSANYNFNSNYPTYAYPNPYQPR